MTDNTGRVTASLPLELRAMLFGKTATAAIPEDLPLMARIDKAHLVMLVNRNLISVEVARQVLRAIETLQFEGFERFRHVEPVRGTYLAWEGEIVALAGDEAGQVHLARSRNDLQATLQRMKLRRPVRRLFLAGLALNKLLIDRAGDWREVLTSGYTHYQPAQPLSLGHQVAGWSTAWTRNLDGFLQAANGLDACPLGAGALSGSTLPIDSEMTASLLGFRRACANSLDAVAARDVVLRLLSAATIMAVDLSRFATDLLLWCTEEFGFVELPDHLVGTSSQMPQKRNPFLLEHVQARGMAALGAFVTAANRMHGTPFTNSVATGTESVRPLWDALEDVRQAVVILRHFLTDLHPNANRMACAADRPAVQTTAYAQQLAQKNIPFRRAHHLVGSAVLLSEQSGMPLPAAIAELCGSEIPPLPTAKQLVAAAEYGGGPGPQSMQRQIQFLATRQQLLIEHCRREVCHVVASRRRLKNLCRAILAEAEGGS